jgi:hypothetical protein
MLNPLLTLAGLILDLVGFCLIAMDLLIPLGERNLAAGRGEVVYRLGLVGISFVILGVLFQIAAQLVTLATL